MNILFTPGRIGSLVTANRLVRSATAEMMADREGRPRPELLRLYQRLARGGVGLIISGHFYVHASGRAHREMTGVHHDGMVEPLAELARVVHQEGGLLVAQINHGGARCGLGATNRLFGPSALDHRLSPMPVQAMIEDEIETMINAFGQAARRVREAGFDGLQIHAAHGYLIGQFLSPLFNRRSDQWGGDLNDRSRFLRKVGLAIRKQVGPDYPVLIKLGMMDAMEGGLTLAESVQVAAGLGALGVDGVELSGGLSGSRSLDGKTSGAQSLNIRTGISSQADEAYFRPLARAVRPVTDLPILLVGGIRSRQVMEDVLNSGDAEFISICRPLIADPDFPIHLRRGTREKSICISGGRCWSEQVGQGISCKCDISQTPSTPLA